MPLDNWAKRDNFSRQRHQELVNTSNETHVITTGGQGNVQRTPHGTGMVSDDEPRLPSVTRLIVTSVLTDPDYADLLLAKLKENAGAEGTEFPVRFHQPHTVGQEFLAVEPIGGVSDGPYEYEDEPVTWEELNSILPPGTGKRKVLSIIDDLDPGTVAWDYVRFSAAG